MFEPFISVIIPVKELNNYLLFENFPALNNQTYKNFEVIVLPNIKSIKDVGLLKKYKWLKILPTNKITRPAEKRDIGVKNAKGSIIAFIDDDVYPSPDWLEKAVYFFRLNKSEVTCGPGILPQKTNIWEKIFDEILKSPIGSGGYQYRFIKQNPRYIDDYPSMNFLIIKSIFQKLGGFNNDYWPGEDSKLCEDLIYKLQGKIYYHPDILVYHHRRDNLMDFLKQHANYGFHRGAFFAHGDRNSRRFSYIIPSLFTLYIIFTLCSLLVINNNYLKFFIIVPLLIYIFSSLLLSLHAMNNTKNILIAFITPFVLFFTHITYAVMFFKGFFTGYFKKKNIYG